MRGAIAWALHHRGLMLAFTLGISFLGVWAFQRQAIDAYPDISAQQVLVITSFPGRAPEEIERQVTIPLELAMGSVPNVNVIRSRTIFGLSVIAVVFDEGVNKYFARQRVQERLSAVQLPDGVNPELGPLATAYGEIYRYELKSDRQHDLTELRTLNDWVVIPRLQRTPGVAEVANFGGRQKQYLLKLNPTQLERYGLSLSDVVSAVRTNNANAGGSVIKRGDMSFVIRGQGSLSDESDIAGTVVNTVGGTPVYLRDVATVETDGRSSAGIFGKDGNSESIEGIVLMRRGENPSQTLARVKLEVLNINENLLPAGIAIVPFYDRQYLVDSTLHTVGHSVLTGIALVLLVLLAFLGSPAVALLVVLTIPFSLLFALVLMYLTDIPIGLLSIGAIDFGILVDGAVVMTDNLVRKLSRMRRDTFSGAAGVAGAEAGARCDALILDGAVEVERPIFFSMLMIISAYVPLLTLTSIEGLLFRPMALTVVYALVGAVLFSLFVIPGMTRSLLWRGYVEWENPLLAWVRPRYAWLLQQLLAYRAAVVLMASGLVVVVCLTVVPRLGFDFLPYLDEGVIWVRANFAEGTSLDRTARFADTLRALLHEFPDVTFVISQAGRNDSGTDPFVPSRVEMMVGLKPKEDWVAPNKQALLSQMGAKLRAEFPTTRFNFTQPIIDSVTEDTNGTSANLAVEFSGNDLSQLLVSARQTVTLLRKIRGAVDVNIEQEGPQPQLTITPDRVRCARYDVRIEDVNQLINVALGGEPIGTLYSADRRFDIVTRFDRTLLTTTDAIGRLPVFTTMGVPIPLAQVADFSLADGQTMIARDSGKRRITVRCDIVGRDQGGFVADAQRRFSAEISIPERVQVRWIGMFENLERATKHFLYVIPVTVTIIYVLLVITFQSHAKALLVLTSVPFAFIGGALALWVRGMTLNVSSGVGFAALFGVSIMDAVLMVEWISALEERGATRTIAIIQGAQERLRPILMASAVAILGLMPASVAMGLGSDIQRPLATVIVWGLVSAMLLTLFVIPVMYALFAPHEHAKPVELPVELPADMPAH